MAVISGLKGTVSGLQGVTLASIFAWRMNLVRPVTHYQVWGVLTGDPSIAGSYNASGTIDCFQDTTNAITVASIDADDASASLVLTMLTGNTYTFLAHLSAIDSSSSRQSVPGTVSFGFTSDGAIVFANA